MILTKELVFCWRYGQLVPKIRQFLYFGFVVLAFLPVIWFWQKEDLTLSRLVLIDVLLGLPLLLALWLTAAIIWQGLVKTSACLFGWVVFTPDAVDAHLDEEAHWDSRHEK